MKTESVNYVSEPSTADRLRAAEQAVERHVLAMKRAEDEGIPAMVIAKMQRQHAENLRIWSGLKIACEQEAKANDSKNSAKL